MNLIESNLKQNINVINEELTKYTSFSKTDLFTYLINIKLQNSLLRYNQQISLNTNFLESRESCRVFKAIQKIQKQKDKEAIEQQLKSKTELNNYDEEVYNKNDYEYN